LAKIDKQKEWVAFWKTSFFGIIGLIFAIIGYTFKNYKIFNNLTQIASCNNNKNPIKRQKEII